MGYSAEQIRFTAKAAADLSGFQYYLVSMSGDDTVNTAAANQIAAGVLQNKPEADQHATVVPLGITKIRAGEACSYQDCITAGDSGWLEVVAASGYSTIGYIINGCNSGGIATAFINMANARNMGV